MAEKRLGKIYGVGVGPGDPELITKKAERVLRECQVIGIPAASREECTAYQVAKRAVPEIGNKPVVAVPVPMTKDRQVRRQAYEEGSARLFEVLKEGRDIAFLNLGDPTVYGTYMELHDRLVREGCEAELVSGVPSFCAVAAQLGVALGSGRESILIQPGCYEKEDCAKTRILMKSGGKLSAVKQRLTAMEEAGEAKAWAVSNCGMPDQSVCRDIRLLDESAGYFTTIIVKEKGTGNGDGTVCE